MIALPRQLALHLPHAESHARDDFLEGRQVAAGVHDTLVRRYAATGHKRVPPLGPSGTMET